MFKQTILAAGMAALFSTASSADLKSQFHGVSPGDESKSVQAVLQKQCSTLDIKVAQPVMPVSKKSEVHMVCSGFNTGSGAQLGKVTFSFGDSVLHMIEAEGNAWDALTPHGDGEPRPYAGKQGWFKSMMVADESADKVWLMSPEALHPHLFIWDNPHHTGKPLVDTITVPVSGAERPAFAQFGASLETLRPLLAKACKTTGEFSIDEPWLPAKPETQVQIDCFGTDYAGFTRKFEMVFGDDKLVLIWILTGKGEEDRVRKALHKAYGEPMMVNDMVEVFDEGNVVLRKDKPEVLMIPDALIPFFASKFGE